MEELYFEKLSGGCVAEDYTIFIGASWDYRSFDKNGAAVYITVDRDGNEKVTKMDGIMNTNVIRLLLFSVLDGISSLPDNKTVRIVTNNNAIIMTLNKGNIMNDKCSDIKARIMEELLRMKKVYISRPISAIDNSYNTKVQELSKDIRIKFEQGFM